MKLIQVTMVRIYVTEKSKHLPTIVNYLQKELKVRGMSVFRAISGYSEKDIHTASLVDLSLDLPLAIEFFDQPDKIKIAVEHISHIVKSEHIVCWDAQANE